MFSSPTGWIRTTGTVIGEETLSTLPSPGMGLMVGSVAAPASIDFPWVQFTDQSGNTVKFESKSGSNLAPRPGTTVTVEYDPANPQNARLAGASSPGRRFCLFAALLPILFVIACFIMFSMFIGSIQHSLPATPTDLPSQSAS